MKPITRSVANVSTDFIQARSKHKELVERLGLSHPDTIQAMMQVLEHAPDELKEMIRAKFAEMGLLPQAKAYTDKNEPLYQLNDIAAALGTSMAKVKAEAEHLDRERAGRGQDSVLIPADRVNRTQ